MSSITLYDQITRDGSIRIVAEWHKDSARTVKTYEGGEVSGWQMIATRTYADDNKAVAAAERKVARLNRDQAREAIERRLNEERF